MRCRPKCRRLLTRSSVAMGTALGAVSDNGSVSQLGARALAHAREKLRMLEQDGARV